MAQAAQISVAAHYHALAMISPDVTEADIEAELHYSYRRQGAKAEAYPSIVAAGENACTLHYVQNDSDLSERDLVLIDAGCELQYYASDVTRTFPVSGVLVLLSATCMTLCWRRTVLPSTPAVRGITSIIPMKLPR